ncbi:MAG TPA: GNAT family N-acetyltransferase [Methylomirabilota bacterium]
MVRPRGAAGVRGCPGPLKPPDLALALLVVVIWGGAFVATGIGLRSFSPPQLTLLRFLIAAAPVVLLAPPPVSWTALTLVGLTLFTGQFLLQFFGIAAGMPPGLAAITVQTQAFFTMLLAALALGERPSRRQLAGLGVAAAGLVLIGVTVGEDLTLTGFGLTLMSAVSWGLGNILVKRLPRVEMLNLVVWLSLVPLLPALVLSIALDGPAALVPTLAEASWIGVAAALYLGVIATVIAYAIWGKLLREYPAATVTPFALLVPVVAAGASALVLGERFGGVRLAGMALVLLGVAIAVLPVEPARAWYRSRANVAGGMRLTPADRADVPGVIALIGRVYEEYGFVYDPAIEVPDLLDFPAHYAPPRGAFFVLWQGRGIVGSIGVERLDADTAELHRLYLDTALRGRGLGHMLMKEVMAWCQARAISRLVLWSDTRFERAHRLYARMGFQRTGERELPGDINQTREYRFERSV